MNSQKYKDAALEIFNKVVLAAHGGQAEIREILTKHFPAPEDKQNPNYPTRTAQDLEIADLKRENNAAFERIQELSAALVALGYDPTSKKQIP